MPGFLKILAEVLFPSKCVFCRKLLKSGEVDFCESCGKTLPFTGLQPIKVSGLEETFAPLYYRDAVCDSVRRFKFRNLSGYATCFGKLMAETVREKLSGRYDLISWVPVSDIRKAERGYDQSMLLAMAMANELGDVPVETLKKTIDVPAQSGIDNYAKRRANVLGVYETVDSDLISGRRILLVDDVLTSGSTLSECATELKAEGASEVVGITLAWAATQQKQ